jgi:hypothetical protein
LIIVIASTEAVKMLPDGVCCALKPVGIGHGLFGGEDFDEPFGKGIKAIAIGN